MTSRAVVPLLLAVLGAACSRGGSDDSFQWTSQVPAGAVVHIRDGVGSVHVGRSAGPAAVVRGTRSWRRGRSSDVTFTVRQQGNDYYICAMWRNSGRCGASGYRGRNTSSFLSMFSLFHRTSDATADFTVELPPTVGIDARTTLGNVEIDAVSGGASAHTVNGTVRATGVSGSLDLSATNGDVRVSVDSLAPADSVRLATTNGSVHAELPATTQGAFDLSVVNGVVQSAFPLQSSGGRVGRHLTGQIGTATRPVLMRSINGTVTVTARGAPASGQ